MARFESRIESGIATGSAARFRGELLEDRDRFLGALGRHEQMIVEVGRDGLTPMPLAASRVVIAAMKPTASSEEWMSSVTLRQGNIAASPALRAASSETISVRPSLSRNIICASMPAAMLVRHGDEDEHLRRQIRPHRAEQFPKVRLAAQSAPHRNATAAATGPITENSSDSAARIRKGGRNGSGSAIAA